MVLETRDGKAIVEFTAPSGGEMELTGSVAIKDKNGQMKMAKYSTKLQVVTKAGSISLPEVSVLYTDWPNKVAGLQLVLLVLTLVVQDVLVQRLQHGQRWYTISKEKR